jgi:hypothetical protein
MTVSLFSLFFPEIISEQSVIYRRNPLSSEKTMLAIIPFERSALKEFIATVRICCEIRLPVPL